MRAGGSHPFGASFSAFLLMGLAFEDGFCPVGVALDIGVEVAPGESPVEPVEPGIADTARFGHGPELNRPDAEIGRRPL